MKVSRSKMDDSLLILSPPPPKSLTASVSAERRDEICGVCLEALPSIYNRWFTTRESTKVQVMYCCGKSIHAACYYGLIESLHDETCAFCRSELQTSEADIDPMESSAGGKDVPWKSFAQGVVLAKNGNYTQALESMKVSAEAGYAESSFYLAQYHNRYQNNKEAMKWYLKASESNDPDMTLHLVRFLYQNGESLQSARIQHLLRLNVDQNHMESCEMLLRQCKLPLITDNQAPIADASVRDLLLKTASIGSNFAMDLLPEREDLLRDLLLLPRDDCQSIHLTTKTRRKLYALYDSQAPFAHYLIGRTLHCSDDAFNENSRPLALFWLRKAQDTIHPQDDVAKTALANEINELISNAKTVCARCKKVLKRDICKACNQCHSSFYCSRECFVSHWKSSHKRSCLPKLKGTNTIDSPSILSRTEQALVKIFCDEEAVEFQERVQPGRRTLNDMCSAICEAYS